MYSLADQDLYCSRTEPHDAFPYGATLTKENKLNGRAQHFGQSVFIWSIDEIDEYELTQIRTNYLSTS